MAFSGFPAAGLDLLQQNHIENNTLFYQSHKEQIKELVIQPFYELIAQMTPTMLSIDAQFITLPSRMVARVRRDTRYTKDKTLYRPNLWLTFRRAKGERESVPCFYFEIHPEFWGWGCWCAWETAAMRALRQMIVHNAPSYRAAYTAVQQSVGEIRGERYKRNHFPQASPAQQDWLCRKEFGVVFEERQDFTPILDGSFVAPMLAQMRQLAPLYQLFMIAKQRAGEM